MILVAGVAGIGKSLTCYTLANALASGTPWLDDSRTPRRVLYCDEENGRADLMAYARWTWRGLGSPARDLLEANLRIESRTLSGSSAWGLTMQQLCGEFRPHLLILDTTTPACHIKDENDNAEAAAACQQIRVAMDTAGPDCGALLLKHLRIDPATHYADVRGAKHWKGAVDAIWYHTFSPGRPRSDGWRNTRIRPEKVRAFGLHETLKIKPEVGPKVFVRLLISRAIPPIDETPIDS